jgi:glycerol kinase
MGNWEMDRTFTPARAPEEMARLRKGWDRALGRAKDWESES